MTKYIVLPDERWVDIPGYDGRYQVSDQGRVRATYRRYALLTPRSNGRNYMRVYLQRPDGAWLNVQVSHLVAEAFCANPNGYVEVDHINADRTDNRACNLQWCTHAENVQWGYDRRGQAKKPRQPKDIDQWGSASGHLYIRPTRTGFRVVIGGVEHGVYSTIEAAVARRNEIIGNIPCVDHIK